MPSLLPYLARGFADLLEGLATGNLYWVIQVHVITRIPGRERQWWEGHRGAYTNES